MSNSLPLFELALGFVVMAISQKFHDEASFGRTLILFALCSVSIIYGYFKDPYAPLYCYAFTSPITNAFGISFAFILGGMALVFLKKSECQWRWNFSLPGLAFCVWSLLSLAWAEEVSTGLDSYISQALAPMVLAFLIAGLRDTMFRRKVMLMVTFACVIGSLASLKNWHNGVGEMGSGGRFYSLIRPDTFSAWELFGIFGLAAWVSSAETARWLRVVMIMILPLLVVGLGLCGFRAAILAAGVGLVMLAVSLNQIWRALGVLLGVAIPAVALTVLVPSLFKTVLGRFGTIAADRGSDRLDIWGDAIKLFWEHPFIGYGTDNFKVIIGRLYGEDMMPHSVYIGTLVELGVIGLILMLIWFAVLLTKAWNAPDRIWVFPLIAAFMFQAAFLHEFYMSCFWLAIGLVEGSRAPVAQKAGSPTLSMQKF